MNHDLRAIIKLISQLDEGRNVDAGVQYKMPTQSYVCPEIAELGRSTFSWITRSSLVCQEIFQLRGLS